MHDCVLYPCRDSVASVASGSMDLCISASRHLHIATIFILTPPFGLVNCRRMRYKSPPASLTRPRTMSLQSPQRPGIVRVLSRCRVCLRASSVPLSLWQRHPNDPSDLAVPAQTIDIDMPPAQQGTPPGKTSTTGIAESKAVVNPCAKISPTAVAAARALPTRPVVGGGDAVVGL